MISVYKLFESNELFEILPLALVPAVGGAITAARLYGPRVVNAAAPYVNKAVDVAKPLVQRGVTAAGNIAQSAQHIANPLKSGNLAQTAKNFHDEAVLAAPAAMNAYKSYKKVDDVVDAAGSAAGSIAKKVKESIVGTAQASQ